MRLTLGKLVGKTAAGVKTQPIKAGTEHAITSLEQLLNHAAGSPPCTPRRQFNVA